MNLSKFVSIFLIPRRLTVESERLRNRRPASGSATEIVKWHWARLILERRSLAGARPPRARNFKRSIGRGSPIVLASTPDGRERRLRANRRKRQRAKIIGWSRLPFLKMRSTELIG